MIRARVGFASCLLVRFRRVFAIHLRAMRNPKVSRLCGGLLGHDAAFSDESGKVTERGLEYERNLPE